jgi:hypothetical protein
MEPEDMAPKGPQLVGRTGIALVHEGERIYPPQGSEALLSPMSASTVNYYFPVEIEVVGAGVENLANQIFESLRLHIEALV